MSHEPRYAASQDDAGRRVFTSFRVWRRYHPGYRSFATIEAAQAYYDLNGGRLEQITTTILEQR